MGRSLSIPKNTAAVTTTITNSDIERKIENATEGLSSGCFNLLYYRVLPANKENTLIICDYMSSMKSEINSSDANRRNNIILLCTFSASYNNSKSFRETKRKDIISFLDSFRKIESVDPLHKWIGTYNLYRIQLMRFFKWLYFPDIEQKKRPKPSIIENIPQLKRKEKSIYKPTDLWTSEEDTLFLRYCPNARDRCYHAMSSDSACRPHELLKLRIKDVIFKLTPDKKQYAEILVNGKTGTRHIPLIDSIPYVKDWISRHPQSGNPNSILLCGFGRSLNRQIQVRSLHRIYETYRDGFFAKLLESPNVTPEDKGKIRELLNKPWNPYIRRHSSLTQKSKILKEATLRQFAGWTANSNMPQIYTHYYGNEASESLSEAYGIVTMDQKLSIALRPKQCPNCNEPNKPDSKFCAKCRMVLTYDAYNETLEKQQEKESEMQRLQKKYQQEMKDMREEMNQQFNQIMSLIQQNPKLAYVKPDALVNKIE
jgi:integrase/recombinase XerD